MNTENLIQYLSRNARPQPSLSPAAAVMIAAIAALVVALVLSIVWLTPRADLVIAEIGQNHVFLLKIAFALAVVFSALPVVRDLSIPGRRLGFWTLLTVLPFTAIAILAVHELWHLSVRQWSHHVGLASTLECLWQIPALAIPALAILMIAVRRLAPTDLVRTGAYIGLAAGGIGALGYAFHCHDDSLAFVAIFYTLAIFEMTILGALLGPKLLKWAPPPIP